MQFINRTKLVSIMAARGMKRKELAQELDITPANLTMKIKGSRMFNEYEISVLNSLFGSDIFFSFGVLAE